MIVEKNNLPQIKFPQSLLGLLEFHVHEFFWQNGAPASPWIILKNVTFPHWNCWLNCPLGLTSTGWRTSLGSWTDFRNPSFLVSWQICCYCWICWRWKSCHSCCPLQCSGIGDGLSFCIWNRACPWSTPCQMASFCSWHYLVPSFHPLLCLPALLGKCCPLQSTVCWGWYQILIQEQ